MLKQIFAHMIGDFVLQNQWMASNKYDNYLVALIHGAFYTVPFLILFGFCWQLIPICILHTLIDHYKVPLLWAKFWGIGMDGWLPQRILKSKNNTKEAPDHIKHWLWIILDQIMHLTINYLLFWM